MEREILYQSEATAVDSRIVELRTHEDAVELLERTEGPDTEAVFGDSVHVNLLQFDAAAQVALSRALGGGSLGEALRRLFAVEEGAWLSDVQDILDRTGTPYTRASYGPTGALYRPPYFD